MRDIDKILEKNYDDIDVVSFYRSIFKDKLEYKGEYAGEYNGKGKAFIYVSNQSSKIESEESEEQIIKNLKGRYEIYSDNLEQIVEVASKATHQELLTITPSVYAAHSREAKYLHTVCAIALELDGITTKQQVEDLFWEMCFGSLPYPTFTVTSGEGVHLYYVLSKPIEVLFNNELKERLTSFKRDFSKLFWDKKFTDLSEKTQLHSIHQSYRAVSAPTKYLKDTQEGNKEVVRTRAFATSGEYTIHQLSKYVEGHDFRDLKYIERYIDRQMEVDINFNGSKRQYIKSYSDYHNYKRQEQNKFNEEYQEKKEVFDKESNELEQRRQQEHKAKMDKEYKSFTDKETNKTNKEYTNKIKKKNHKFFNQYVTDIREQSTEGGRYNALLGLVAVSLKSYYTEQELKETLKILQAEFNSKSYKTSVEDREIESLLKTYKKEKVKNEKGEYVNLKHIRTKPLEELSGIIYTKTTDTKRNGLKQSEHLQNLNKQNKEKREAGEWDYSNTGRPVGSGTKEQQIKEYVKTHKKCTVKNIAEDLNITVQTVRKYVKVVNKKVTFK